jgi:ABC-type Na+ efflux pump permease subunit
VQTVYDWLTVGLFAGLVVLFLQRSMAPEDARDQAVHYIPPALGCAFANYLGNKGMDVPAILVLILSGAYAAYFLKLWPWPRKA